MRVETQKKEEDFDFKEVVYYILKHWRSFCSVFLIVIIIGTLASFGIAYRQQEPKKEDISKQLELLSEDVESTLQNISTLQQKREEKKKYLQESVAMQLNPLQFYKSTLLYYIQKEEEEQSKSIISAYSETASNGEMIQAITADNSNVPENKYVNELISCSFNPDTKLMKIQMIHSDKQKLNQFVEQLKQFMKKKQEQLNMEIGSHSISILSSTLEESMDSNLEKKQEDLSEEIQRLENSIANDEKQLEEKKEIQSTLNAQYEQASDALLFVQALKSALLYSCIALFLLAVIYLFRFAVTEKLQGASQIERFFGIRVLEEFYSSVENKRYGKLDDYLEGCFADRKLIRKLEEEKLRIRLISVCGEWRGKRLLLLGEDKIVSDIANVLNNGYKGIEVTIDLGDSILESEETFQTAKECDYIIMVKKKSRLYKRELKQEIEILSGIQKQITGLILK